MSPPAGGGSIGDATITVNANTDPAILALNGFSRDAQGRIRDVRGRFIADGPVIPRSLPPPGGGGVGLGAGGAAAGTAAPLLAGIVTTLQNVAPAGAVAVTGMLAVQQASA